LTCGRGAAIVEDYLSCSSYSATFRSIPSLAHLEIEVDQLANHVIHSIIKYRTMWLTSQARHLRLVMGGKSHQHQYEL
jgi:hypothetical protein